MVTIKPDGAAAADAFAQLAVELHDAAGVEETVQTVVDFALQALNCSHACAAGRGDAHRPGHLDHGHDR
jgi:hypothetical protein